MFTRPLREVDGGSGEGEPASHVDENISGGSDAEELAEESNGNRKKMFTERLLHDPKERSPAAHAARHC